MNQILQSILTLLFLTMSLQLDGQSLSLVSPLSSTVHETSGLDVVNGKLITHNDSGGDPFLYEIDSLTGNISRTVVVANAFNTDWEDITTDSDYIYLGDFGNNSGSRTDLKIFRVAIPDFLTTPNDTVYADTTFFSYADQTDFTPTSFQTNYDAEALISFGDSLYIFSKNWGNGKSYIYALPKNPGTYSLVKRDSIDTQGQVTAATFNPYNNSILLTGYAGLNPFLVQISHFTGDNFASGHIVRVPMSPPSGYSYQIESVICFKSDYYYLTAEDNFSGNSGLFSLESEFLDVTNQTSSDIELYPNPCTGHLRFKSNQELGTQLNLSIYNLQGQLIQKSTLKTNESLDVQRLNTGTYLIEISSEPFFRSTQILVIQ